MEAEIVDLSWRGRGGGRHVAHRIRSRTCAHLPEVKVAVGTIIFSVINAVARRCDVTIGFRRGKVSVRMGGCV
jgi:hypothetical protein